MNSRLGLAISLLESSVFSMSSGDCLWEHVENELESIDIDVNELRVHYEAARTWANKHRRQTTANGKCWYPMQLSWEDLEEGAPIDDILEALRNAHWFHICSLP